MANLFTSIRDDFPKLSTTPISKKCIEIWFNKTYTDFSDYFLRIKEGSTIVSTPLIVV
jgi:hypothetical protein